MTFKLGKLAPKFPEGLRNFADYATAPLPAPPSWVNWERYNPLSPNKWPMDGNDHYGDCVTAAAAHQIQSWNFQTKINDPVPTEQAVVNEYFALTGGKDSGLVISNTLRTWQNTGLWGNKLVGFAPVPRKNKVQLQQAIAFYGGVTLGFNVPANAFTQFDNGQPWSLQPGWQNQRIEGGHCVPVLAYNAARMYCVTWGQIQAITWDWFFAYGDEAWVLLSEEFSQAGRVNNLNIDQLRADLSTL
jgi:hypothetical protein